MSEEIMTTDASDEVVRVSANEESAVQKTDTLPKSWTDLDRQKYVIVRGYLEAVDAEEAVFVGVPDKVVKRARRDVK